jgi:hypothetical protein
VPPARIFLRDAGAVEPLVPTVNGEPEDQAAQNQRVAVEVITPSGACALSIMRRRLDWLERNCTGAQATDPSQCRTVFDGFFR